MRRAWWIGLGGVLVLCLAACEVDEGNGGDGGTSDTGDSGGDGGGPERLCLDNTEFQDSCLADFFTSCYAPAGTCSFVERSATGFSDVAAIVWQNGHEWEERFDNVDRSLDVIVRSSSVNQCASANETTEGVDGEWNLPFTPEGGTDLLTIITDASGNLQVHCPGGAIENYQAAEGAAATMLGCLGATCNGERVRDQRQ